MLADQSQPVQVHAQPRNNGRTLTTWAGPSAATLAARMIPAPSPEIGWGIISLQRRLIPLEARKITIHNVSLAVRHKEEDLGDCNLALRVSRFKLFRAKDGNRARKNGHVHWWASCRDGGLPE